MKVKILLNGTMREAEISSDQLLIDFVRDHGCYSVKRGCETSNCGLCTVFVDDKPVLSCSMLTARVDGCKVDTLEGLQEEAKRIRCICCRSRCRTVRFLQFGNDHECNCHVPRESGADKRRDQDISCGKSLQMFRI